MLFLSQSATVYGIDALIVDIEVNLQPVPKEGDVTPPFSIVGLPDTAIRDHRLRNGRTSANYSPNHRSYALK